MFDHERLEVYRLALRFDCLMVGLVPRRGFSSLRDQVERAGTSIVACIAEGAGRRSPADKRHFYAVARGSATECASLLDLLRNRRLLREPDYQECRALLLSVVRILSKLSTPTQPELEPEPEPAPSTSDPATLDPAPRTLTGA